MIELECVILAGGKSSRMGTNKALLPFGGFDTLAQFQLERLKGVFRHTYISAKDRSIFAFEADFLEDNNEIFSPSTALLGILKSLQKSVFILSVDTPFVDESVIDKLFAASENGSISTIAKSSKLHPLCAVYSTEAIEPLEKLLAAGDHKLRNLIKNIPHKEVDFTTDEPFFNLNKIDEYEEAKNIIAKIKNQ